MASPLRDFNRRSIDDLVYEGVEMFYDHNHRITEGGEYLGMWVSKKSRVYIYPGIRDKKVEDITIVHEWLHAYEFITLETSFRENQIEWWAHFHLRRDYWIADYIRFFFPDFRDRWKI